MINPNRKNPSNAEIEKSKKFLESFSFACINASKLDFHVNSKDYKFHPEDAKLFIDVVERDLLIEQIDIISPHIIIGSGLTLAKVEPNLVTKVFGCKSVSGYPKHQYFHVFEYTTKKGLVIPFIDSCRHFSDFDDLDIKNFINELTNYLKNETSLLP